MKAICLFFVLVSSLAAEPPAAPQKKLPLSGEVFLVAEHTAFIIPGKIDVTAKAKPWVWYAPTLPNLPGNEERWMFDQFIAAGIAIPSRSRHCLRRYLTFLQRLRRGEVDVGHVPDVENPSDFLTKWVSREKTNASLEYATNFRNVVKPNGHTV